MKKSIIILAALSLLAISCQKSAEVVSPQENENTETRVPVRFGSNITASVTKGAGALEAWNGTQQLYIYGIAHDANNVLNMSEEGDAGILINNVPAFSPAPGEGDDPRSGSITVQHKVTIPDPDPNAEEGATIEVDQNYFYGFTEAYDFFGYYVDDAVIEGQETPAIDANNATVTLPIVIDGSQDILLAKAAHPTDTGIEDKKLFSAKSARAGVHPVLKFEHQLSRFNFKVRSGYDTTDELPGKIVVAGIELTSKSAATLNIIGGDNGLTDIASPVAMKLQVASEANPEMHELTYADDVVPQVGEDTLLNGSLLVMPGDAVYNLDLYLYQLDELNLPVSQEPVKRSTTIDFQHIHNSASTTAQPGKAYTVSLVIFGLEKIEVQVDLVDWIEDGDFEINPDE